MYAGGIKKSLNVCDVVIYKTKFHAMATFPTLIMFVKIYLLKISALRLKY